MLGEDAEPLRTQIKYLGDVKYGEFKLSAFDSAVQYLTTFRNTNAVSASTTLCVDEVVLIRCRSQVGAALSGTLNTDVDDSHSLRINARLGGMNFIVDSPILKTLAQKRTIIVGMSILHFLFCSTFQCFIRCTGADVGPVGSGFGCPAVVGIVFSVNAYATKYLTISRLQMPREERIHDLAGIVKEMIERYLGMMDPEIPVSEQLPTQVMWCRTFIDVVSLRLFQNTFTI